MNQALMSKLHQQNSNPAPWACRLTDREARTLAAEPQQRWLRVDEGCLWLTRRDSHGQREDDVWLAAGDSLALPAGSEWVLEAWPQARVSLLQQATLASSERRYDGRSWLQAFSWLRFSLLHA